MQAFEKKSFIGLTPEGRLSVHIDWDGKNLSITGSEGRDHGGQIIMSPWDLQQYAEGYNPEVVAQLRSIWERWHLNDMQAGSPAQMWPTSRPTPWPVSWITTPRPLRPWLRQA